MQIEKQKDENRGIGSLILTSAMLMLCAVFLSNCGFSVSTYPIDEHRVVQKQKYSPWKCLMGHCSGKEANED